MSFARMLKRKKAQDPAPQAVQQIDLIDFLGPVKVFSHQNNPYAFLYPDDPADYLSPAPGERFELRVHDIDAAAALRSRIEGVLTGQALAERFDDFPHREAVLFDRLLKEPIMASNIHEMRTNAEAVVRARGSVLIGGLGIGMGAMAMARKAEVTEILILEKEPEIIALVGGQLQSEKIRVIEADVFTWHPTSGEVFDSVWIDIWNSTDARRYPDCYPQMAALRERYTPCLAPGGWLGVWQEAEALVNYYRSFSQAKIRRNSSP